MDHMFWPGPDGSETYCDLQITTERGNMMWTAALESLKQGLPLFHRPLFIRRVVVDFTELAQRRLMLTDDPSKAIPKDDLDRLLANEASLRRRLGG